VLSSLPALPGFRPAEARRILVVVRPGQAHRHLTASGQPAASPAPHGDVMTDDTTPSTDTPSTGPAAQPSTGPAAQPGTDPAAQPSTGQAPWWSPRDSFATAPTQVLPPPPPPGLPPAPPEPPAAGRPGPRYGRAAAAGVLVLAVALGSGLAGAEIALHGDAPSTSTVASGTVVKGGSSPTETLAKVAAAVQPSVVSIEVATGSGTDEGSGVIMRSDGAILTNNHVIAAAASGGGTITVTFSDGKTAKATIVGRDESTDLAVIKATGVSGLKPATFGDSDSVHVGDTVLAIGSPLGLEGSVSAGIISALHRPVDVGSDDPQQQSPFGDPYGQQQQSQGTTSTVLNDAIQTDAPINPGNSGGPLVDAQGRVIGINSAIASLSSGTGQSGNIGVGFAIPVDEAQRVATQLLNGQKVTHAVLGVQASDVQGGARVEAVTGSSGADKAGLKVGDVITKVGNTTVTDATELTAAIRTHAAGDTVQITYTRDGSSHTTTATLSSGS
jgi:putative serine protease PepD